MKIYIDESHVMRVSRKNEAANIELKEVHYFKYLGSVLTRDGYCTWEIKMRIAMAEEAIKR